MRGALVLLSIALLTGCYRSHRLPEPGEDAGACAPASTAMDFSAVVLTSPDAHCTRIGNERRVTLDARGCTATFAPAPDGCTTRLAYSCDAVEHHEAGTGVLSGDPPSGVMTITRMDGFAFHRCDLTERWTSPP